MYTIIFYVTTILAVVTLISRIKRFLKDPLRFDHVFYIMYFMFYYLPVIDSWYGLNMFGDEYLRLNGYQSNSFEVIKFAVISYIIVFSFMMAFDVKVRLGNRQLSGVVSKSAPTTVYSIKLLVLRFFKLILILLLVFVLINVFMDYGNSIRYFFSMARKDVLSDSWWQRTLIGVLPALIFGLEYIEEITERGKIKYKLFAYAMLSLMVVMVLGQRRELLSNLLFVALILVDAKTNRLYDYENKSANRKIRRYIVVLGVLLLVLIPVTWYMRVYSTQLQYGRIVNPFEKRGWIELLFGSSSSGLQTSIILDEFKRQHGLPFIPSIRLMLTYFIPRSIYANKASVLTSYVKDTLGTNFNLSVFYVNDVWFNFYLLSPIFSFIIGAIINRLAMYTNKKGDIFLKIPSYFAFSLMIALFKNGYVQFFYSYIVFISIWISIRMLCTKKYRASSKG